MTSEAAFLRSLAEEPGDLTTLLVFADWLEDQDDPLSQARAELLRVQAALADCVADAHKRVRLLDREQELLRSIHQAWLEPILPFCESWRIVLGLPRVTMQAEMFLSGTFAADAEERLRRSRVRRLRLENLSGSAALSLARTPYLQSIAELDLSANDLKDDAVRALAHSPYLSGLVALDLSNNLISEGSFGELLASPNLAGLVRLDVRNNHIRYTSGLLPDLERLPRLRHLAMEGNDLEPGLLVPSGQIRRMRECATRPGLPWAIDNCLGMKLALIPAGIYDMGSPASEEIEARSANGEPGADERPRHRVTLSQPFYLGVYPVTQREYQAVMGVNPSDFNRLHGGSPDHPVEMVTWDDAQRFCDRLSDLSGEAAAGRRYRLPTEAEWEYACRAGSGSAFSWGDSATSLQANFDGARPYGKAATDHAAHGTTRVGSYQPNLFGLFDMHGNVWEWCQDWYDNHLYDANPRVDPTGPRSGNRKATRGGSWSSGGSECRSACRDFWYGTSYARNNIGFRVVLMVESEAKP
jgi:uncharacterized protein (TIGR02996 family)